MPFDPTNIYLPFWYGNASVLKPTLFAAIRDRIHQNVSGLSNVYMETTQAKPTLPVVIMNQITSPTEVNNSPDYWSWITIQFTVLSNDDVQAVRLAHATRKRIGGYKFLFEDGYFMAGWPASDVTSGSQDGIMAGGVKTFMARFDYTFMVGREG